MPKCDASLRFHEMMICLACNQARQMPRLIDSMAVAAGQPRAPPLRAGSILPVTRVMRVLSAPRRARAAIDERADNTASMPQVSRHRRVTTDNVARRCGGCDIYHAPIIIIDNRAACSTATRATSPAAVAHAYA